MAPGKRNVRTVSQQQKIDEEMSLLEQKRTLIVNGIKKLQKQFENEDIFGKWSKGDLNERIRKLSELGSALNENNMEMVCKNE